MAALIEEEMKIFSDSCPLLQRSTNPDLSCVVKHHMHIK